MILETERLRIHPASDEEMRALIANEEDEGLKLAYGEMLAMAEKHPDCREWYAAWFIENTESERLGELCFKGLSAEGSAELGYGILPAFQNRGYATEAVNAVTAWALSDGKAKCITAETEEDNAASKRVLLKCGFAPTGAYGEEGPLFRLKKDELK